MAIFSDGQILWARSILLPHILEIFHRHQIEGKTNINTTTTFLRTDGHTPK